ncbi:MAG: hypothetical protein QF613_03495 [Candidatus Marinimicrobia bacterium]|nr:hypothetical protein [Candidatus Neomarinimicrobiota bacterium]
MITIYVLSAVSFLSLLTAGLQGYFGFPVLGANHPTFALLTAMIYLFTEVLVMFFFVGTGVSIKEYVQDGKAGPEFHQRSVALKRKLYSPTLLNVLLVMALFIIGGAVDTGFVPDWGHGVLFLATMLHFVKTLTVQHACFKENTAIILEMTGVGTDRSPD